MLELDSASKEERGINIPGRRTGTLRPVTITSRHSYDYTVFEVKLLEFLKQKNYSFELIGYMEYHHEKHKGEKHAHMHGLLFSGTPPKNNRKNEFYFKIEKPIRSICELSKWTKYCLKNKSQNLFYKHIV